MARRQPTAVRRIRAAVAAALADLDGRIGVACSGGADSVALADAAVAAVGGARVTLIHVDHRLAPGSAAVGQGVAALAARLGAACQVVAIDVAPGPSLEDQARIARYAALDRIAATRRLAAVLTGHTARDQAETVLLRVVRGTGPGGLAGIPARRGRYRRPLLAIRRAEVEAYVAALGLPAVADPMNDDPRFARVRARRSLMPALAAENPRVEDALLRLARSAAEWAELVDRAAAAVVAVARREPAQVTVEIVALAGAGAAAAKRALQLLAAPIALDAEHLDAAWALIVAPPRGSRGLDAPGLRLERVYDTLVISAARRQDASAASAALRRDDAAPGAGSPGASRSDLMIDGPDAPYLVRRWRPGDRMQPARLRGRSKKISDLFVDAKVPQRSRRSARVVVRASDDEIVWAEHLGAAFGVEIRVTTRSARTSC